MRGATSPGHLELRCLSVPQNALVIIEILLLLAEAESSWHAKRTVVGEDRVGGGIVESCPKGLARDERSVFATPANFVYDGSFGGCIWYLCYEFRDEIR